MSALSFALIGFACALFAWLLARTFKDDPTLNQWIGWSLLMAGAAIAVTASALKDAGAI